MKKRIGIVTLPEPSLPALFSNIGPLQRDIQSDFNVNCRVVFIMNSRYYKRIRRLATQDEKYLHLLIYMERLRQFDRIKLIDYWNYYNHNTDAKNIDETINQIANDLDIKFIHNACDMGHKWWYEYARSPSQELIREAIGADMEKFRSSQASDYRMWEKEGYRGDKKTTNDYIYKILSKVSASLLVRKRLQQTTSDSFVIAGIAGGKEYKVAEDIIIRHGWLGNSQNLCVENCKFYFTSGINEQIITDLINRSSTIAQEVTGINEDSRFVLTPWICFLDIFDVERISESIRSTEISEVKEVLDELRVLYSDRDDVAGEITYYTGYITRTMLENPPQLAKTLSKPAIEIINANFSPFPAEYIKNNMFSRINSLRLSESLLELKKSSYSDAAVFIAALIITDPLYNNIKHAKAHDVRINKIHNYLVNLFNPPTSSDKQWLETQFEMESWTDHQSWYQLPGWFEYSYI